MGGGEGPGLSCYSPGPLLYAGAMRKRATALVKSVLELKDAALTYSQDPSEYSEALLRRAAVAYYEAHTAYQEEKQTPS